MNLEEGDGQGEGHREEEGQISRDSVSRAGSREAFWVKPTALSYLNSSPTVP